MSRSFTSSVAAQKGFVHSILHAHLVPRCPHADIFGGKGRAWLRAQVLPDDERTAVERHIAEHDRLTIALKDIEKDIAQAALADENVQRLMTIPGIDMIVAVGVMAAIGRIDRFGSPDALVAYIGLNPSVFQSGDGPARHGRITKRGRSHARFLLVEAAWQTVRSPVTASVVAVLYARGFQPFSAGDRARSSVRPSLAACPKAAGRYGDLRTRPNPDCELIGSGGYTGFPRPDLTDRSAHSGLRLLHPFLRFQPVAACFFTPRLPMPDP
ncbi:Transposase IS116/IS110/IS902 family protein [Tranquillimonas alkanivorans]|uniref:Transposase IS116/IS110/IS902 family protein n=1 Tax=Tranquillimonas alkanivorans TaxID=441119 RepID=A0A1I5UXN1_9RHOB|nr:Transposase IS116/IS110/IS902 family protein [Tranquillimonas alkanivorans]